MTPDPVVWLAATAACWFLGWALLWRVPRCRETAGTRPWPRTTVIIPARNEAENLRGLLPSLSAQAPGPDQVLVVDDHSSDGTAETARTLGAEVRPAPDLPVGWVGKAWACAQGAQQASGEVLVFLDADTRLEPGGWTRLLDTYRSGLGVLSLAPYHVTRRLGEQVSAFFNLMQMAGVGAFTCLGRTLAPSGLFGPCLVISRTEYEAVGGHAAVKGKVLENFYLAAELRRRRIPLRVYGGAGTLSYRMYPGGWSEAVAGWSKAFSSGAGRTPAWLLALTVLWISGFILAAAGLAWAGIGQSPLGPWLAAYAAFAVQAWVQLRRAGRFSPWTSLLYPAPLAAFLAIFARSAWWAVRKRKATWKGRAVPGV